MLLQRETSSTPLPARLIDVGLDNTESPRLVDTAGQTGHYVALSHCWGSRGSSQIRLTTSSMSRLRQSLEPSKLPRWVLDAIVLTRNLGVRYIWIDALCIVQDDQEERLNVISTMSRIYHSAILTIAAAGTNDELVDTCINSSVLGQPFSIFLDWSRPTVAKSLSYRLSPEITFGRGCTSTFPEDCCLLLLLAKASDMAVAIPTNKADTINGVIPGLDRLSDSDTVERKGETTNIQFDEASREIQEGVHHVEAGKTFEALALFMKARELASAFQPLTPRSWTIHAVASANIALIYQIQLLPAIALDIAEASLSMHRRLPTVDRNCTLE